LSHGVFPFFLLSFQCLSDVPQTQFSLFHSSSRTVSDSLSYIFCHLVRNLYQLH
jgi:hypothetical protein